MLKIWLTWLQPSLGVLGTALVLSNPLLTYAAPGLDRVAPTKSAKSPQWSNLKFSGTKIEKELLKGIATTPDQAIRQLAISTMATSGIKPNITVGKVPQNFNPLSNFTETPASFKQLTAKTVKPQLVKPSTVAKTVTPQAKTVVPELLVGTGSVSVSSRVLPTIKPVVRTVDPTANASTQIQLAAITPVKTTVATPFPVVRPETMDQLQANPVFAKAKEIKTATLDLKSISAGLPKPVESFNPVASIPAGLQQLLGNNFDSSTKVVAVPVAKATGPNFRSMAALTQLVTPGEKIAPATVTMSSLQLATAKSYANTVIKFTIPGETVLASPVATVPTVKQKTTTVAVSTKNSGYVAIVNNRSLKPEIRQSWTNVGQRSSLGGLILGSQQLNTLPKVVSFLPVGSITTLSSIN